MVKLIINTVAAIVPLVDAALKISSKIAENVTIPYCDLFVVTYFIISLERPRERAALIRFTIMPFQCAFTAFR